MGMESAKRLQKSLETKAAKSANIDPLTGEAMDLGAHERTSAQIWQDEKEHGFFVQFLADKDTKYGKAIVEALSTEKSLTPKQDEFLESGRMEFNLRRAEVERLRAAFTVQEFQDIASTDKNINAIIGKIGQESAHELLMGQIENLAFTDSKKFQALAASMKAAREVAESDRARGVDYRVRSALERIGMTEEKYFEVVAPGMSMAAGVPLKTKDDLERVAKENMNVLMTLADVVSGSAISRSRAREVIGVFETQRDLLNQRNLHLADVAKVLKGTITPEMRVAMQKVMLSGGEMQKVPETNVDTISQYKEAKENLSSEERKKRFADAFGKEAKRLKKGAAAFLPAEKDAFLESFAASEEDLQKKKVGRGLFAALLALIFKSKADIKTEAEALWP